MTSCSPEQYSVLYRNFEQEENRGNFAVYCRSGMLITKSQLLAALCLDFSSPFDSLLKSSCKVSWYFESLAFFQNDTSWISKCLTGVFKKCPISHLHFKFQHFHNFFQSSIHVADTLMVWEPLHYLKPTPLELFPFSHLTKMLMNKI